jgi:uncharacterized protein YrrD
MSTDDPVSYLTLASGTAVRTADGTQIGTVKHVLADADADIFDGLVIDADGHGSRHRFVDSSLVAGLSGDGVTLSIDAAAAERLPEPAANPATLATGPDDTVPDNLSDKLKRAWARISGDV